MMSKSFSRRPKALASKSDWAPISRPSALKTLAVEQAVRELEDFHIPYTELLFGKLLIQSPPKIQGVQDRHLSGRSRQATPNEVRR
jgi:hypothetical protein